MTCGQLKHENRNMRIVLPQQQQPLHLAFNQPQLYAHPPLPPPMSHMYLVFALGFLIIGVLVNSGRCGGIMDYVIQEIKDCLEDTAKTISRFN